MAHIPTVVLDQSCAQLEAAVAEFAPTFVFVRSKGFLDVPGSAAEELDQVLAARGVPAPYILVGASFAAFTMLLFASRHRRQVCGLILVDPSHPLQGVRALERLPAEGAGASDEIEQFRSFLRGFGPAWEEGCRQVSSVRDLGDIPIMVLAAGAVEMPEEIAPEIKGRIMTDRHRLLRNFCGLTSKSEFTVVEGVGHDITSIAPTVVLAAIKRMFDLVAIPG